MKDIFRGNKNSESQKQSAIPEPPTPQQQALDLVTQAVTIRSQGKFAEAMELLDKAIALDPSQSKALYEKASILEGLNRTHDAFLMYQRVVKLDSSNLSAWSGVGSMLLAQGRFKEAIKCFEYVITNNARHAKAWYGKAKSLLELKEYDNAMECYEKALDFDPRNAAAWSDVGYCLDQQGKHQEALSYYDETLTRDPRFHQAWNNKGLSLNALERFSESIQCFEKALQYEKNPVYYFNLAETYVHLGDDEKALEQYDEALSRRSDFADALYMKVVLFRKQKKFTEMQETVRKYLAYTNADDPRAKIVRNWIEELSPAASPAPVIPPAPAKYEVQKVLMGAGTGKVYVARSIEKNATVALKTFDASIFDNPSVKLVFKREAKSWIDLGSHPNIVQAHGVEDYQNYPAIILDYMESGALSQQVESLDPQQANKIGFQICTAMEYAYSRGIKFHGDLKPANIFLDANGDAKVSDFGIGSVLAMRSEHIVNVPDENSRVRLSYQLIDGTSFGTPPYMSPEQFAGAMRLGQRSDIYSFGILFYELVAKGRVPFSAELPANDTQEEQMQYWNDMKALHLQKDIPKLETPVWKVIEGSLKKNPVERFQTFSELKSILATFL